MKNTNQQTFIKSLLFAKLFLRILVINSFIIAYTNLAYNLKIIEDIIKLNKHEKFQK